MLANNLVHRGKSSQATGKYRLHGNYLPKGPSMLGCCSGQLSVNALWSLHFSGRNDHAGLEDMLVSPKSMTRSDCHPASTCSIRRN